MSGSTRDKLLDTAETLFAERGFYGVSIANIASELSLTKQALLHHFSTKEKLYGEVLKRISDGFEASQSAALNSKASALDQFVAYVVNLVPQTETDKQRTRLLMRELLDNRQRADTASTWYLKPFLNKLVEMLRKVEGCAGLSENEALTIGYQFLGAINYYGISGPTIRGIFGEVNGQEVDREFPKQLENLIRRTLSV